MDFIENQTFDEIALGATASLRRTLTWADIQIFAVMSGDVNPAHVDQEFAKSDFFHTIVAHGMWGGALISTLLGTRLPGPGTIYLGQTLRFKRPVSLGDTITVTVTVTAKDAERQRITFDCLCVNQRGEVVISGTAEVIAPTEKVKRVRAMLPEVHLHDHGRSDLIRRLRSAEGHLRGIIGMVEAGASCHDTILQVLAVQGALREVNRLLLRHSLHDCLRTALSSPDAEARERALAGVLALYELRGALALPPDREE